MVTKERGAPGVALVIGAVCGIGFEVARQFARRGMMVILGARDAENGEAATEELAGTVDVAEGEGLKGSPGVEEEFGSPDVVVNNAAVFLDWSETASTADPESSPAVLDTDLFGAWRVAKGSCP